MADGSWATGKAELVFDGLTVHALTQRGGDYGVQIRYSRGLETITQTINSQNVVTRLKGRGVEGLTIEGLDVSSYSDADLAGFTWELQGGKKIITQDYIDSIYLADYPHAKEAIKEWTEIEDQIVLLEKMKAYIHLVDKPEVSYDITFAEFARQGVPFSDVNLGDVVTIIDESLGIQVKARIVELDRNPLKLELSRAVLATRKDSVVDYLTEITKTRQMFEQRERVVQGKFSELEGIIESTNKIINGAESKVVISDTGILCIQTNTLGPNDQILNTTKLLKIQNGAIGISVDGGNTFRTAMTPEGVHADKIIGDLISARTGSFGNIIVKDSNNAEVVRIGSFKTPDGIERNGIKINSGALYIDGGITRDQMNGEFLEEITTDVIATIQADIDEVDDAVETLNQLLNDPTPNDITALEADQLKRSLDVFKAESTDIINHAVKYGITTEKDAYQTALTALETYLNTWIGKAAYPIAILSSERANITVKMSAVQSTKSALTKKITDLLDSSSIKSNLYYNGVKIDAAEGLTVTRSDNKIRTVLNATDGFKIQHNNGTNNWANSTYIDTNGNMFIDDLYAKRIKINDSDGNTIINAATKLIDFSKFNTILGKITGDNLNVRGITVTNNQGNTTFAIDQNGNATISGNINMTGGSISWANVPTPTYSQINGTKPPVNADKTSDVIGSDRLTKITANGIYTGDINASQITTGSLSANRISMPGSTVHYAEIGGSFGNLSLYSFNSEYFRIENRSDRVAFLYKNLTNMVISDGGSYTAYTRPEGKWSWENAEIYNFRVYGGITFFGTGKLDMWGNGITGAAYVGTDCLKMIRGADSSNADGTIVYGDKGKGIGLYISIGGSWKKVTVS